MASGQGAAHGRILFLNWRDVLHPDAGGAEVYCSEIARRFVAMGYEVTLFTARAPGTPSRSLAEGVEIVRRGGRYSLYGRAVQYLLQRRDHFTAVVDCQNGIPFFAPLLVGPSTAVVAVVHHVHQEQFASHFHGPMRVLGQLLEGPVSRWVYRSTPAAVVSPSTRKDVRRALGFRDAIYVVPNGAPPPVPRSARSTQPAIAVATRLVRQKRLHLLIDAAAELARAWHGLTVDVVGAGPDQKRLEALARGGPVRFHGYLPEAEKVAILSRAWLTVNPSQGEGWGLNVLEAAALGIPTVAFDVAGLRDSILDGVTGWLVGQDGELACTIDWALRALANPADAQAWANRCQAWSSRFSWDDSALRLHHVIGAEVDRKAGGHARPMSERRRRSTDLTCLVDLPAEATPQVLSRLRRTDVTIHVDGRLQLLMHGGDERDAQRALERAQLASDARISIARSVDLLVGSSGVAPKAMV